MRAPRSTVPSVVLYNQIDESGEFIPQRFEVNGWITLMSGKRGGHAKDTMNHGGSSSIDGAWKAKILQFRFSVSANGSAVVSEVLVQHAYRDRQLELDPVGQLPTLRGCNYLYPSIYEDWVHPSSLTGVLYVVHADIGEPARNGRSHKELLHDSLFYYNATYFPRVGNKKYGRLEPIPLPAFDDPSWPLPDMCTTEAFRRRMQIDFQSSMKSNMGSRQTHLQWFLPVPVMVDLFAVASSIHRTPTLFVFKNVSEELLASLMDNGWDSKVTHGIDKIKCEVDHKSIVFRFHIGRSTLYTNFQYNRQRFLSGKWVLIDQVGPVNIIELQYEFGSTQGLIEAGQDWLLSNVRQELTFTLGLTNMEDFIFFIVEDGQTPLKINRRNEKNHTANEVAPPKRIRIVLLGDTES